MRREQRKGFFGGGGVSKGSRGGLDPSYLRMSVAHTHYGVRRIAARRDAVPNKQHTILVTCDD